MQPPSMIDASALLAYLQAESGVAAVANVLTPRRYVAADEEDDVPFERADGGVVGEVGEQLKESGKLEVAIRENLQELGYEV